MKRRERAERTQLNVFCEYEGNVPYVIIPEKAIQTIMLENKLLHQQAIEALGNATQEHPIKCESERFWTEVQVLPQG